MKTGRYTSMTPVRSLMLPEEPVTLGTVVLSRSLPLGASKCDTMGSQRYHYRRMRWKQTVGIQNTEDTAGERE